MVPPTNSRFVHVNSGGQRGLPKENNNQPVGFGQSSEGPGAAWQNATAETHEGYGVTAQACSTSMGGSMV